MENHSIIKYTSVVRFFLLCIVLLIPYAYYSVAGLRVVLFTPLVLTALLYLTYRYSPVTPKVEYDFYIYMVMLLYGFISVIKTHDVSFLSNAIIFFAFCYWPYVLSKKSYSFQNYFMLCKLYVIFTLLVAIGVVMQVILFYIFSYEIGEVTHFLGRTAFAFTWKDFSYVSLYIASAIPLVSHAYNGRLKYLVYSLMLFASLLTTARTGVFSILVVICFWFLLLFASDLSKKVIKNYILTLFLLGIPVFIFAVHYLSGLELRQLDVSDNGRFIGYARALQFWEENLLFGAWMHDELFRHSVGVAPHHVIIYALTLGGFLFFIPFVLWLLCTATRIIQAPNNLMLSCLIVCFGFNFIPGLLSAYFFGFLISLTIFYNLTMKEDKNIERFA